MIWIESTNLASSLNSTFANKINLGDEGAPAPVSAAPVKEVVKKSTSSKKADTAPAPKPNARSNKKPAATGNEAAFRNRDNGRAANRSKPVDAPAAAANKRSRGPRADKHSNTGKVDTDKKVHKGWGDDKKKADDEAAGEEIAKEEIAEDAAEESSPAEEVDNSLTLEQYLESLKVNSVDSSDRQVRKANEGADDKWKTANELSRKEQESFVAASKSKTVRSKERKEKVFIDFEPVLGPSTSERPARRGGDRRFNNGGRRESNRGGRGGAQRGARKPTAAVNISNPDEFPVLGA